MKKYFFIVFFSLLMALPSNGQMLEMNPLVQLVAESDSQLKFKLAADGTKFYNASSRAVNINETACTGDIEVIIYDENFEVASTFTINGVYKFKNDGNYRRILSDIDDLYATGLDIQDLLVSKGMFTNDGKWCVIIRESNYEQNQSDKYTVYNEDSNKVGEINLSSNESPCVVYSNGTSGQPYFATTPRSYYDPDPKFTVYSFNKTNKLSSPTVVTRNSYAWPNPLPNNSVLTIDFGKEAPAGTFVTFSNMNGRVVEKTKVETGATSLSITPNISRGAYIYTIYFGNGEVLSDKLIAE